MILLCGGSLLALFSREGLTELKEEELDVVLPDEESGSSDPVSPGVSLVTKPRLIDFKILDTHLLDDFFLEG